MSRTLCTDVSVEGTGLHTGMHVHARLIPREEPGIVFLRRDLPDHPRIPATVVSLADSTRHTVLCRGEACVATVEHLLAACWGLDITGLLVEMDAPELPIGDGSSLIWVEACMRAEFRPIRTPRSRLPDGPITVRDGTRSIALAPAAAWSVHFAGDLPAALQAGGASQRRDARLLPSTDFVDELAGARTFCRLSEVAEMRRTGLIRGGTPESSLVCVDVPVTDAVAADVARWWPGVRLEPSPEGLLEPQRLRWPNECARHKLLDVIGDLALARPLSPCRVECSGGGHALTHRLLRQLERRLGEA